MPGKALAVVSGKGGSGKTIIATEIAVLLAQAKTVKNIVLVDADLGTAGLSLYLGVNEVRTDSRGLSTVILEGARESRFVVSIDGLLKPLRSFRSDNLGTEPRISLLPVGDFKSVNNEFRRTWAESGYSTDHRTTIALVDALKHVISELKATADMVIVDCRGGIDDESIAVCKTVDDIILIGEMDTTSFDAGLNLIEIFSDGKLVQKVKGLIFNKIYRNPEVIRHNAPGQYETDILATIPFDLAAARAFTTGNIPSTSSPFGVHVQDAINRAYPDLIDAPPEAKIWKPGDFDAVNVFTPGAMRAGIVGALILFTISVAAVFGIAFTPAISQGATAAIAGAIGIVGAVLVALVPLRVRRGR
ncbi:MAG TPA: ParA family protein [Streptosporangiaceae bacterium]|nr:ParA family protein [Streptosporangiaceae bacterium]